MAFKFRPETVLRLRRASEAQATTHLAAALRDLATAERSVRDLQTARASAENEHEQVLRTGFAPAQHFLGQALFQSRLAAEVVSAEREIESRAAVVQARRQTLAHAAREREALERLKDKHRARFRRELNRRDARLADELYLARYARRTTDDPAAAGETDDSPL